MRDAALRRVRGESADQSWAAIKEEHKQADAAGTHPLAGSGDKELEHETLMVTKEIASKIGGFTRCTTGPEREQLWDLDLN
jgi:hypothetical protein